VELFGINEHPGDLIRWMLRSSITIKALFALFLLLILRLPLFLIFILIPVYYSWIAFRFRFSYQYFDGSCSLLFCDCLPLSLFVSILQQKFGDPASYPTCKDGHGFRNGFWTDFGLLARAPPEMSYEQDLGGIQLR
jgi:hypothetical protein